MMIEIVETAEPVAESLESEPLVADEVPRPSGEPDALSAMRRGAELLEAEETALCVEAEPAEESELSDTTRLVLDQLAARVKALSPEGRVRFASRLAPTLGDAHRAVQLVNDLMTRGE